MAITRVLFLVLIGACAISGRALALPCGDFSCDGYNGVVTAHQGSSLIHPVVPLDLTIGKTYTTPQQIASAWVGSAFTAPNQTQVFLRANPADRLNTPTDYATLGNPLGTPPPVIPVTGQTTPLTLDPVAAILRPPAPVQYSYGLIGTLDAGGAVSGGGTLSFLYALPQDVIGFDVYGVDTYSDTKNPNSYLYIAFFADDGALIDNLTLNLQQFTGVAQAYSLWFDTAGAAKTIKGITLSTTDRSGVSYADFEYEVQVPAPPVIAMMALPLLLLVGRQRRFRFGSA